MARTILLRIGVVLALLVLVAGGALWWLVGSEPGLRWALERARAATGGQLSTENARGTLIGAMRIGELRYRTDGASIEANGVQLAIDGRALFGRTLAVDRLHLERLVVRLPPQQPGSTDSQPPGLPDDLSLPIDVHVDAATIGTLEVVRGDATWTSRNLFASYGGGNGNHRLRELRADSPWGHLGAAGDIGASRPFAVNLAVALVRRDTEPAEIPGELGVHVGGTLQQLQVTGNARSGDMRASAKASLTPFTRPWPQLLRSLQLQGQAIDLARLGAGLPGTRLSLQASAEAAEAGRLQGRLQASNAWAGALDRERVPVASIASRFSTDFAGATLEDLVIDLEPGGQLSGQADLRAEPLSARLELRSDGLDLRALRSTLRATALDGPLRVVVQGPAQQQLSATLAQEGMRISAQARRDGNAVAVRELDLRAYGGTVTGNGNLVIGEPARFDAALRVARFDPAQLGDYPRGSINGDAEIEGSFGASPQVRASWTIADSTLRGQPLRSRGSAHVVGRRVARLDASATLGRNQVDARGAFGGPRDRLQWRIDVPALGQLADGLAGQVNGRGTLTGTPADGRLSLQATGRSLQLPAGIGVRELRVNGAVGLPPQAPLDLQVTARGVATPPLSVDELTLDTDGTMARHTARLHARAQQRVLDTELRGGWRPAQGASGAWVGTLQSLLLRGVLRNAADDPAAVRLMAPASLSVSRERVVLRDAAWDVGEGSARVEEVAWQPGRLASSGRFEQMPTSLLATVVALPADVQSTLQFDGDWSIVATPRLDGSLTLRRSAGDVRLAGPPAIDAGIRQATLSARFDGGRMRAELALDARLATVNAEATIAPDPGAPGLGITAASPLQLTAQVDVEQIRLIAEPLQAFARVSGSAEASLRADGTLGQPRLDGDLRADDLELDVPPYGVYLRGGELRARLEGDVLRVERFVIQGGDGAFTASGTLPLRPADGGAALAWKADGLRVLNRPDMRLVVTGNGALGFDGDEFALRGTLRADRGYFEIARNRLPDLGEDVVVGRQQPPAEEPARAPLDLDLQVDLGDDLRLRGLGLQGQAKGQLRLTTNDAGELRASGRVETVDATFSAYGQELVVDPGVLVFDGPIGNPTLQVTAWRRNQQVEAGVQISGTAEAPRVSLVSDPPVAEGERLSWLVLGRPPGDASGGDIALLQAAAGAFLGRGEGVPLTDRIASSLGLDEFAIRGSREIASQVVAFGKQLSDRLYVTYEHGLDAAAENLVKLDYALTRRISLRAETGTSAGFGVLYRFSWD